MLAFSQAGLGAGRRNSSVNNFGVALSRVLLVNEGLLADVTHATDVASLGTSRVLDGDHTAVAGSLNNFLSNQHFFTDRAVLAFSQAGFGAGRSNSSVNHFGVASRLLAIRLAAKVTQSLLGASGFAAVAINQTITSRAIIAATVVGTVHGEIILYIATIRTIDIVLMRII